MKGKSGQYFRRFVAATYDALWQHIAKRAPTARHFYEARLSLQCSLLTSLSLL